MYCRRKWLYQWLPHWPLSSRCEAVWNWSRNKWSSTVDHWQGNQRSLQIVSPSTDWACDKRWPMSNKKTLVWKWTFNNKTCLQLLSSFVLNHWIPLHSGKMNRTQAYNFRYAIFNITYGLFWYFKFNQIKKLFFTEKWLLFMEI